MRVLAVGPTWPGGGGRSLSVPPSCESISIRAYLAGGGVDLCLFPHPVRVLALGPTWPGGGGGRSLSVPHPVRVLAVGPTWPGGG